MNRCSWRVSGSSRVSAKSSSNTVAASAKLTPCARRLAFALSGSHSNLTIQLYRQLSSAASECRPARPCPEARTSLRPVPGYSVPISSRGTQPGTYREPFAGVGRFLRVRKTSCCCFFSLALKSGPLLPIWGDCQLPGESTPKCSRNHIPTRIVIPKGPLEWGFFDNSSIGRDGPPDCPRLLITKRSQRVDFCSAPGRDKSRQQRDGHQQQRGREEHRRVHRAHFV